MACIYKITCTSNNKFYIGSALNLKVRKGRHLSTLRHNKHHNIYLQRIFNKYGEESLIFSVVEECNRDILLTKEQFYIDKNWDDPLCVNLLASSTNGDTLSKHPRKKEIIELRSKSFGKTMVGLGEYGRKERYGRKGEKNGSFGRNITEKERVNRGIFGVKGGNIRKKQIEGKTFEELYGKAKAKELKDNISNRMKKTQKGKGNGFFGKTHSKESIEKMRKNRVGSEYGGNTAKPFTVDGIEFISLKHASDNLDIPIATVKYRIKSKNFGNYEYL